MLQECQECLTVPCVGRDKSLLNLKKSSTQRLLEVELSGVAFRKIKANKYQSGFSYSLWKSTMERLIDPQEQLEEAIQRKTHIHVIYWVG